MQILKAIGLLMEYPDEFLWQCKEEVLAMVRHDAPMLNDFVAEMLNDPLLDKQAEWCEVFDRGRATSLLLFEHVHAESAIAARQWSICSLSMKKRVYSSTVANFQTICRCIWNTSASCRKTKRVRGYKTSRRFWRCWAGGSSSAT